MPKTFTCTLDGGDLVKRTSEAATRLLKILGRKHAYQERAKHGHGTGFEKLVYLEEAFEEEALQAWKEVLAEWSDRDKESLRGVLNYSAPLARASVLETCGMFGQTVMEYGREFFDRTDIYALLLE